MGVARQFWSVKCGYAVHVGAVRERAQLCKSQHGSLLCVSCRGREGGSGVMPCI